MLAAGCSQTIGEPADPSGLGYQRCQTSFECGEGRHCNDAGFCWTECRSNPDCALIGGGLICDRFGHCLAPDGQVSCTSHAECGPDRYCNGICTSSGAHCGSDQDCPYQAAENCRGLCGARCGVDNDCLPYGPDQECTPIGQCLNPGWERWIPPGELPPTSCHRDGQCQVLGWRWVCDCPKVRDTRTGLLVCQDGFESTCAVGPDPLDLGDGPTASPAHALRGVWGMRVVIGSVTYGLPLVSRQPSYSSNLLLVKVSHPEGNLLVLQEKVCKIDLINFRDDDQPFADMAWMVVPKAYLHGLVGTSQTVELASANPGEPFETSQSVELRGLLLEDPLNDPVPDRSDYLQDPGDVRFWDQDQDGHVAMTVLMDGVLRGGIYGVQRWKAVYHGEIQDSDHIRGLASVSSEQLLIDASRAALLYETYTEIHVQVDRTFFRMQRLDQQASCADLIREAAHSDSWLQHSNHMLDLPDP